MTRTTTLARIPHSWFECWRDPKEFFCNAWGEIKPLVGHVPPQYLRDAYVAGLLAQIWNYHSACEVKLPMESERFPDAQLREKHEVNTTIGFEIITADKPGRRTWKEQRKWVEMYKRGELVPIDSPDIRREYTLEAIPAAVKKKAEKNYGTPPHLVVYSMIGQSPLELNPLISPDKIVQLTKPYSEKFQSIWLLCGIELLRAWPEQKVLRVPPGQDPFCCASLRNGVNFP